MTLNRRQVPTSFCERFANPCRVLLGTHEHPDADGLGSLAALGLVLLARGFPVARIESSNVPRSVAELPGVASIAVADPNQEFDFGILFDCHQQSRLGRQAAALDQAAVSACVDHHPDGDAPCTLDDPWIEPDSSATAIMVLALIRHCFGDDCVTPDVASCLYAGLVTDTGGFRHENTTVEALEVAAFLVDKGADPFSLTDSLLHRRTPGGLALLADCLSNVAFEADGRIAHVTIGSDLLERTGARIEEAEGVISHLTSVEGVELSALIKTDGDGRWRVSLRASGELSVDGVARDLGGGGHRRAAAFVSELGVDELRELLIARLCRELNSLGREPGN